MSREDNVSLDSLAKPIDASKMTFNGSCTDHKYLKMKKVISSIQNFLQTRADDEAIKVDQYLQALSLSLDLSIFDPYTNIAGQFYIILYELMNVLEPGSLTLWYCVDVLSNACKNCATRQELIKNFTFIPCLAKIVGDHLTLDKKNRLLRLIQILTCGIKISWQIPHLTHLITHLAKWTEANEQDIVTMSMGILVNLCYKNLAAIYTLQRNIDMKRFFRNSLALEGPILEVYICQLSLILETICCYVPQNIFPKLMDSTFTALREAYLRKDGIMSRQVVDFFVENATSQHNILLQSYTMCVEKISDILEFVSHRGDSSDDPQCIASIIKFIHFFVEQKPCVILLYSQLINFSLKWIQDKTVSYDALALLKTLACSVDKKDDKILEQLTSGLPVFVMLLKEDSAQGHVEHNKRLGALLQLFKAMIQVKSIQETVAREITEDMLCHIFVPLLGDDSPRSQNDTCSTEAVNMYVYTLALVGDLAKFSVNFKFDTNWTEYMNSLLENRQIHIILAQAICQSPPQVKKQALELSGNSCSTEVSLALERVQAAGMALEVPHNDRFEMSYNVLPFTQNQRLDHLIEKLEASVAKNGVENISTSEIMELYGYKLSHLAQAERIAQSGLEMANLQNAQAQHRISQMQVEYNRMQQLQCHATQKIEDLVKKKEEMDCRVKELQNKVAAYKNQSKQKDDLIKDRDKLVEKTRILLMESNKTKANLEEQLGKLQVEMIDITKSKSEVDEKYENLNKVFKQMQDNLKKKEKTLKYKEELLEKNEDRNGALVLQINDLERDLKDKIKKLEETQAELITKSQIIQSIMKMANTSQLK